MTPKLKAALSLFALVLVFVSGWLVNGWRLNGKIEAMRADHAEELVKASEKARKREQAMQGEVDGLLANLRKEQKDAQTEIKRLTADIAAGRVRLSIAVSGGLPAGSGAESEQTRADIDAETAQSLVAITDDGDAAIRELNVCIDAYEAVRQ